MFGNARIIRFAALSLALLTVAASAETFTVDLDLSGYPNIQFDIGRRFSAIQSVTFTCSGTMLAGLDYRGQPFSGQVVLWLRANPGYKIAEGPLAGQSTYPAAEPFTGQSSFRLRHDTRGGKNHDLYLTGDFLREPSTAVVRYSAVRRAIATPDGSSVISVYSTAADPCFVDAGYWDDNGTPDNLHDDFWVDGDYHLKSQAGRWDPAMQSWVIDDVTSPCIDAGDPMTPIGHEPFPNGGRINMGVYGGTIEASKSYFNAPPCETIMAGDINGDCRVDFADFHLLSMNWLRDIPTPDPGPAAPGNGGDR